MKLSTVSSLTTREREVLHWIAQGKTNPEIGMILDVSSDTVKKHATNLFAKLGVCTRTAAARCVWMEAAGVD